MKKLLLIIIIVASINAQNECEELSNDINGSLKRMAFISAEHTGDDSVPRLALAEAETNNEYNRIMVNIKLMEMNNCSPIKIDLPYGGYLAKAMECYLEQLNGNYGSDKCDISKW